MDTTLSLDEQIAYKIAAIKAWDFKAPPQVMGNIHMDVTDWNRLRKERAPPSPPTLTRQLAREQAPKHVKPTIVQVAPSVILQEVIVPPTLDQFRAELIKEANEKRKNGQIAAAKKKLECKKKQAESVAELGLAAEEAIYQTLEDEDYISSVFREHWREQASAYRRAQNEALVVRETLAELWS